MADKFARSLLAEIETQGLDELILSQHTIANEHEPAYLGIPTLDTLLQSYLHFRAEPARQNGLPPLIEIAGAGPCSGKTQLLYRIAAALLLGDSTESSSHTHTFHKDDPESSLSQGAPGSQPDADANATARPGGLIIWIDCSSKFDIRRLDRVLSSVTPSADLPSRLATLTHLHLHRPASFSALLDTLSRLPSDLLGGAARTGASPSAHRHVAAVILSAASSFLPFERAAAHSAEASQTPHKVLDARYARLIALLRTVQQRLGCPVIATRQAGASGPGLPAAWVKAVDVRLRLSRGDWREKVPRGISVLEALEWREGRRIAKTRAEREERDREQEEREMRSYLESRGLDADEVEREFDGRDTAGPEASRAPADLSARFDGSVAGKGREASDFALRVDSSGVWIEAA